ncbi:alpha/beta fold hydrolase [Nonomuraea dietziae]|uniref:alpha/beta fold hydrolase n=1 Tax=Nonomuraea dietziae TaxID=65515 RepID=UPI0033F28772
MRAIARDQVEVMRALGYERFAVAGHDRGARCAYRMALDHPEAVARLAVLDIVPTGRPSAAPTWTSPSAIGCGPSWRRLSRCPSG